MNLFPYLLVVFGIATVAAILAWAMVCWPVLIDSPNARSSHVVPTPRGGGVGIVAAFMLGLLVFRAIDGTEFGATALVGFVAAALLMAAAGLADDFRPLRFVTKLAAQLVVSAIAIGAGIIIDVVYVPGIGPVALGPASYLITLLWLVGATNAFNFMDGLDGLAGGTALLAAIFLCAIAVMVGDATVAAISLIIAGASAGFLLFNFPPARIFMGDVGSQFLGFTFAALGVLVARNDTTGTFVLIVPLLLFHFLFDTIFTSLRRMARGENPTAAHRSHLYQLLNRAGFDHRQVAVLHYLLVVLQGVGAIWLIALSPDSRWLVFVPFFLTQGLYAAGVLWLFRRKTSSDIL